MDPMSCSQVSASHSSVSFHCPLVFSCIVMARVVFVGFFPEELVHFNFSSHSFCAMENNEQLLPVLLANSCGCGAL